MRLAIVCCFLFVRVGIAIADTATGIAVDSAWKREVYEFALKNVKHPSWGLAHSERNYQVTKSIAAAERTDLDFDVLFASAFLHDLGGLDGYAKDGVDHGVRSVELIEPMLRKWGFPMGKFPQVREMILGHVYNAPAPSGLQSIAFRDADILDFLGAIGVARILAVTMESDKANAVLKPTVDTLRLFAKDMAAKCITQTCKDMAKPRQQELLGFLNSLDLQTFNFKAL